MLRVAGIVPLTLLLLFGAPVHAQGVDAAQFEVVERFVEALSAGSVSAAQGSFRRDAVWSEYDLFRQVASGLAEVGQRIRALIGAGVRLEVELVGVHAGGMVLVTHERMWGDFVPQDLAPLRSVAVYVVERGVLTSVNRVLAPEQRDALAVHELARDTWQCPMWSWRFEADGRYRATPVRDPGSELVDSGSFAVTGGVLALVSDEASRVCDAGAAGTYHVRFHSGDRFEVKQIDEDCLRRAPSGAAGVYTRRTEAE